MVSKLKNLRKDSEGFTIIEVLIVLAIAGLILLIVFLAVPALQRNARNTARKNDVASILGAMSEYTNNNGGTFPATCTIGNCTAAAWVANAKTGTILPAAIGFDNVTTARAGGFSGTLPAIDQVQLYNYAKCGSATTVVSTGASVRSLVAFYPVESGGSGTTAQCVESGS